MKIGSQTPRIENTQKYTYSSGMDACKAAEAYGLVADKWQRLVINGWLAESKTGLLVHSTCGISVPRQNGKNAILEIVELYKMAVQERKILHTAHEVKTARKAFKRLKSFFESPQYPELRALVKEIRQTNGQEAIELTNGGSCEFVARTRGSGRGYTVDDMIFDEAQELTEEQLEALTSTNSSAPSGDPQDIYLGTPPGPSSPGTVFPRMRARGASGDKDVAWFEWSIPDDLEPTEAKASYEQWVYETNPALGIRLTTKAISKELNLSAEGFCRERLGQWRGEEHYAAINLADFKKLFIDPDEVEPAPIKVFAIRFTPDGAGVALAGAQRDEEGRLHVEALKNASMRDGTSWLIDFMVARRDEIAALVVEGRFGVGFFCQALKDAGFPTKAIITPNLSQVVTAHSTFEFLLKEKGFTTINQTPVLEQVKHATKRPIGKDGGFGWATGPGGGSVALLEAMTYALWAAKTTKRRPRSSKGSGVKII